MYPVLQKAILLSIIFLLLIGLSACGTPFSNVLNFQDGSKTDQIDEVAGDQTYSVSFIGQGGSLIDSQTILHGETATEPAVPPRGENPFIGWYDDTTVGSVWDFSTPVTEAMTIYARWQWEYWIGEIGPAGGWIFYIDEDAVFDWTFLEAAPENVSVGATTLFVWGGRDVTDETEIGPAAQGTAIGTGSSNTAAIVAEYGDFEPFQDISDYAAKLANDLIVEHEGTVFDDWFLPSLDELVLMTTNLHDHDPRLGGFLTDEEDYPYYWTSTEGNFNVSDVRWFHDGSFGATGGGGTSVRDNTHHVRAARAF